MCYSFRLTARVLLCAPSYRQDNTYHGLCYTSRGALAGTTNAVMVTYGILFGGIHIVFISMICMYIEMFPVSIKPAKATMVVYGILFDCIHLVSISMMKCSQNATMVIYGNLFWGMHPLCFVACMHCKHCNGKITLDTLSVHEYPKTRWNRAGRETAVSPVYVMLLSIMFNVHIQSKLL